MVNVHRASIVKTFLVFLNSVLASHRNQPAFCTAEAEEATPSFPSCARKFENFASSRNVDGFKPRNDSCFPAWINLTLARQGQQFVDDFFPNIAFSHILGVMIDLSFPDAVNFLIYSNHTSTPEDGARRYTATVAQILVWYYDLFDANSLNKSDTDILISLKNVREIHLAVAERGRKDKNPTPLIDPNLFESRTINTELWDAFSLDLANSKIPKSKRKFNPVFTDSPKVNLNHLAASLTQFAMVGYPVLFPERLGFETSDDNLWAFNHLWAVLGYALGIDDEYNVALQPDIETARSFYKNIFDTYITRTLFNMGHNTLVMEDVYLLSLQKMIPVLNPSMILYRVLTMVLDIEAPNTFKQMTVADQAFEQSLKSKLFELIITNIQYRKSISPLTLGVFTASGFQFFPETYTTQTSRAQSVYYA